MKGKPVKYTYHTSLTWTEEKKGIMHCKGKPDVPVACPPEFGGHPGIWSPEDLFLGSIEVCTMTTFLWFVYKKKIHLTSYRSTAQGTVELVGHEFQFSSVEVTIDIKVPSEEDKRNVENVIPKIPRICLVSASIKSDIHLNSKVTLG
jgi:organic hydroperoxide reductase OsmC/OhrA